MLETVTVKEPSSDYLKVEMVVTARCLDCDNTDCEHALAKAKSVGDELIRYARLKDAVIEAAKPWRMLLAEITTAMTDRTGGPLSEDLIALNQRRVDAEVSLIAATDALVSFESEQVRFAQ